MLPAVLFLLEAPLRAEAPRAEVPLRARAFVPPEFADDRVPELRDALPLFVPPEFADDLVPELRDALPLWRPRLRSEDSDVPFDERLGLLVLRDVLR